MSISKSFVILPLSLLLSVGVSFAGIKLVNKLNNLYQIPSEGIDGKLKNPRNNFSLTSPNLNYKNSSLNIFNSSVSPSNLGVESPKFSNIPDLEVKLEEPKNLLTDVPSSFNFGKEININDSINQIISEENKEFQIQTLKQKMVEKTKESESKLKQYTNSLEAATQKINNWSQGIETYKKLKEAENILDYITKNSFKEVKPLEEQDKESLVIFYKEFLELAKSKKSFIEELSTLTGSINEEKTEIQEFIQKVEKTLNALESIEWVKKGDLSHKLEKLLEKSSFYDNNPFWHLLTQDEWELLKRHSSDIRRDEENYKANSLIIEACNIGSIFLFQGPNYCYRDMEALNRKRDFVKYSLDWRIGSKLLHDMKRAEEITKITLVKSPFKLSRR